jgi:hypothetical protein
MHVQWYAAIESLMALTRSVMHDEFWISGLRATLALMALSRSVMHDEFWISGLGATYLLCNNNTVGGLECNFETTVA